MLTRARFIPHARVSALALLWLASVPLVSHAVSVSEASNVKPGKIIDVSTMKGIFPKKTRVAVAGYQVAFVTRNKATAHAANLLGGGSGAKASLETFLGNVDYALMQSIADEAYAGFLKRMEEAGLEVVPLEQIKAAKAFAQLETRPASAEQAYTVQFQGAHYILVPGGGLPLWFNHYDGLAGGKGSKGNMKVMAELAKELDAAVLQPSIAVDFSYLEKSGGNLARRASVEAQNGMLVVPAASVFWGSTEHLTYTKFVDGFWAEGATGKWVKAEEATNRALVKGLISAGIDIGPVRAKKAIVLEADPAVFKAKTLELLHGTSDAYKRAVQELRR
jgi:hypothetical protein